MKNHWKILLGAVICITAFLIGNFSQAKTIFLITENANYKINIFIVFDFKDDNAKEKADELIITWQEGMNNIWDDISSEEFRRIEYEFELIKMEPNKECLDYPEYHCISVVSDERNQRGNMADVTYNFPNSGINSIGEWTINVSGKAAAHEVGHLMGLLDEYHYEYINGEKKWINDNIKESEKQSIMAQTWGEVKIFDDQINKILRIAGIV